MKVRQARADAFYSTVMSEEEPPWFVADDATAFDFTTVDTATICERILREYGAAVSASDLHLPFWRLLDLLEARRNR